MVSYVQKAHDGEFFDIWLKNGGSFEILLYNMHIQARKLETVDT